MVTTDGRRLSIASKSGDLIQGVEGESRVLIPRDIMYRLQMLLSDTNADKVMFASEGYTFSFRVGQETLSWTIAEGVFPDYETIMPKSFESFALVNTGTLSAAIRRVIQLEPRTWGWRQDIVRLDMGEKELKIGPTSTEFFDEFAESIDATYSGERFMVGLNADFILDILETLGDTNEIRIGYVEITPVGKSTPSPAICIENLGSAGNFRYLLMAWGK
jgi:DNA polymerase-3 subunit beta